MNKISIFLALIIAMVFVAGCTDKNTASETPITPNSVEEQVMDDKKEEEEKTPEKEESEKKADPVKEANVSTDLEGVKNAIITIVGIGSPTEIKTSELSSLYNIKEADVKQSACFITGESPFPGEIVMIEATDKDAASAIEAQLRKRLKDFKEQSKSYDEDNYKLAQNCSVDRKGCVVTMFLSSQNANIKILTNALIK